MALDSKFANLADRFKVNRVSCILIDETQVQIGKDKAWVWLAFEPYKRAFLGFHISWTRKQPNCLAFLKKAQGINMALSLFILIEALWYPLACKWARLIIAMAMNGRI
jgi:transposase-like protein